MTRNKRPWNPTVKITVRSIQRGKIDKRTSRQMMTLKSSHSLVKKAFQTPSPILQGKIDICSSSKLLRSFSLDFLYIQFPYVGSFLPPTTHHHVLLPCLYADSFTETHLMPPSSISHRWPAKTRCLSPYDLKPHLSYYLVVWSYKRTVCIRSCILSS